MDQLLGFVVLTGPLFLIVLWVPVCIALAVWVAWKKIDKGWKVKVVGGFAVFLLALFLPVTDVIVDRVYLKHLCETEADVKVLNTVKLSAKYWNEDGTPKFMNDRGALDYRALNNRFEWKREDHIFSSTLTTIHELQSRLMDKENNSILIERNTFFSDGGWIEGVSHAGRGGGSCQMIGISKYGKDEYFQRIITKEKDIIQKVFFGIGVENGNN